MKRRKIRSLKSLKKSLKTILTPKPTLDLDSEEEEEKHPSPKPAKVSQSVPVYESLVHQALLKELTKLITTLKAWYSSFNWKQIEQIVDMNLNWDLNEVKEIVLECQVQYKSEADVKFEALALAMEYIQHTHEDKVFKE